MSNPTTLEDAKRTRYGVWAGNPMGRKYNPTQCAYSVYDNYFFYQCSRKPGHGPDGLYCKQHAKMIEGRRK